MKVQHVLARLLCICIMMGTYHSVTWGADEEGTSNPTPPLQGKHCETLQLSQTLDIGKVAHTQEEKKETGSPAYSGLVAWFHRFVDTVEYAEEWKEVGDVLAEGQGHNYLDKCVTWDDDMYTPLHYAAEVGDLEVVQALVEEYTIPVDIKTKKCERTPLHFAALRGQLAIVEYLAEHKCNLKAQDKDGSCPVHYAALGTRGTVNTEVVAYLHERGINLGIVLKELNLLHLAIKVGNTSLVKYLLEGCPTLIDQQVAGMTPLAYAKAKQEMDIVAAIQEKLEDRSKPCWSLLPDCRIH